MRILILLQSTTGNTKVITRFVQAVLRDRGHECQILDVTRDPATPPDLEGVDLLGVACPTMYFRPTFTMERYVTRMPNAPEGGAPVFLLGTCGGMPGAHFELLGGVLRNKGYVPLGAYWVLAPSNWPPHIAASDRIKWTDPLAAPAAALAPRSMRPLWAALWERSCQPDEQDREGLLEFVDQMVTKTVAGDLRHAPSPRELYRPAAGTGKIGRIIPRELPAMLRFRIDRGRCTKCGTCINVCSEKIISRTADDEVPTISGDCSGCYACFNRCPDGAIYDEITKPGVGQYAGPPRTMKDLFRWP